MKQEPLKIKGVWLLKQHEHLGNRLQVIVELPDSAKKVAIDEIADDGPISHCVHPAGITSAPTMEQP